MAEQGAPNLSLHKTMNKLANSVGINSQISRIQSKSMATRITLREGTTKNKLHINQRAHSVSIYVRPSLPLRLSSGTENENLYFGAWNYYLKKQDGPFSQKTVVVYFDPSERSLKDYFKNLPLFCITQKSPRLINLSRDVHLKHLKTNVLAAATWGQRQFIGKKRLTGKLRRKCWGWEAFGK